MTKFKIKLRLQGFELDMEGDRADMPAMAHAVGQQLVGLLEPSGALTERPVTPPIVTSAIAAPSPRKKRPGGGAGAATQAPPVAVDWKHDPQKWGTPKQNWVTADKAIWLLHVCGNEVGRPEMGAKEIEATFNKHFKEAGAIQVSKINRDLGKRKIDRDAPVGQDTSKNPSLWYLTQSGKSAAASLVQQALTG